LESDQAARTVSFGARPKSSLSTKQRVRSALLSSHLSKLFLLTGTISASSSTCCREEASSSHTSGAGGGLKLELAAATSKHRLRKAL